MTGHLFHKINNVLVGDFVMDRGVRRYLSIIFMLIAVASGVATYQTKGWFFLKSVSYFPGLTAVLIAMALIMSFYLRRILPWPVSVFSLLSLVLNITVTAILVQVMLGKHAFSIFNLSMPALIGIAIAMTWLGMRPLAPLAWGLVLALGFWNLQSASDAMGNWGYLFMISAFLGILLQFDVDIQDMIREARYDFVGVPVAGKNGLMVTRD